MHEYGIYYRRNIDVKAIATELPTFDIYVSAYNTSDRVKLLFEQVRAPEKIWIVHPEYVFMELEYPANGKIIAPNSKDEVHQVNELVAGMGDVRGKSICVDITGFMRHVLTFLLRKLQHLGVSEFTALYSEPVAYSDQENTLFSTQTTGKVGPVKGMAGSNFSGGVDHLILGVGFDHKMMGQVLNHKDNMKIFPVFGFPSLSPDMYQQSAIKSAESGDAAREDAWVINRRFAPANDPFSTAAVISSIIHEIDRKVRDANIYLAPLSTKVQALGFAIYWMLEGHMRTGVSIILPECVTYSRETSTGLKRLWAYTVELA